MEKLININPNVGKMIESLKSSGYDLFFAIADLVDNSIDAKASFINIEINIVENSIKIIDNGIGMTYNQVIEALRLGSDGNKNESELGKFGFGLKSASFSQCNLITVSSKKNEINEITFDVTKSIQENKWIAYETAKNNNILDTYVTGTVVQWNDLYRLGKSYDEINESLKNIFVNLDEFIGSVFCDFIDDGIDIRINDESINSKSPFYYQNPSCKILDSDSVYFGDEKILVRAYDITRVKKRQNDINLIDSQGIYVFRNNRMIKNIGWIAHTKHPSLNNIRVRFDIGSKEDELLNIDFKKSNVDIPDKVKNMLIKFEKTIVKKQAKNLRVVGEKKYNNGSNELINIYKTKNTVDKNHIIISNFLNSNDIKLNDLNAFFKNINKLQSISDKPSISIDEENYLYEMVDVLKTESFLNETEFYELLSHTMPYKKYINIIEKHRGENGY